jgi:predicted Zn-ribbon and HTH transcriptional regulator
MKDSLLTFSVKKYFGFNKFSIALLLFSLVYLLIISYTKVNMLDEGFLLYGSVEVMDGKLPYKDFFIPYTPGFFLLHAFMFKGIPQWNTPYPSWYASIFGLISIYFVIIAIEKHNHKYLFFSGIFVAFSILFKQNIGAFAFLSIIIFLFLIPFLYNQHKPILKIPIKYLLPYILGLSLILIPFIIYINSHSLFNFFIDDVWIHQIQRYRFTMNIPFPSIVELIPDHIGVREIYRTLNVWRAYTPILIYAIIALICTYNIIFHSSLNKKVWILLLYLLFGSLQFLQIYPRYGSAHLAFSLPLYCILGCYLIYITYNNAPKFLKNPNPRKTSFLRLLILLLPMLYMSFGMITVMGTLDNYSHDYSVLEIDRAKILVSNEQKKEITEVVNYIKSHTERDDKILVVPFDAMYYFLTERDNPCKYNQFLKDFDKKNQQEVIQSLKENDVKYILYRNSEWMNMTEIAPELDNYIKKHYSVIRSYTNIEILSNNTMNR